MTDISDELLMAYADNELSPRERESVEAGLKRDAALRARLEPFVATGSGSPLAELFDEPLHEPVPARLINAVVAAPLPPERNRQQQRPRETLGSTGWLESIGSFLFPESPRLAATFGLAALLVAGGAAGWVLGRSGNPAPTSPSALVALSHGELVASGPLLVALETEPSKALAADAPATGVLPLQTFRSSEGAFCREYRAGAQNGSTFSGVACRQAGGEWRIAAHVEAPRANPAGDASGYETASGPASETLNAVVDALIQGDVLGAEDEAAEIARKWAPPRH